jgi:hypothetical protein
MIYRHPSSLPRDCALTVSPTVTATETTTASTPEALRPRHDAPCADDVVRVARKQSLAVGAPCQADALGLSALLANSRELRLQLVDLALLLKVEDDDAAGRGGAEPVTVRREDESVDLVIGVEGVEVLGLVKIPEHGRTVLAAGCAEGAIR